MRAEAIMKHAYFELTFLAVAVLLGCEGEDLSIGRLRCQGARCGTPELSYPEQQASRPERTQLEGPVAVVSSELPCPYDECYGPESAAVLTRDSELSVVVAAHVGSLAQSDAENGFADEHALWIGRHAAGGWQGEVTIEGEGVRYSGNATTLAIAVGAELPEEAVIVVAEPLARKGGSASAVGHLFRVFRYGADDRAELLFESDEHYTVYDAARIGQDILVLARYEGNDWIELTRYTPDGEVVFRQTALQSRMGGRAEGNPIPGNRLHVVDDDTIAVLVRCPWGFELAVVDGEGSVRSSSSVFEADRALIDYSARFATGTDEIIVGIDGYLVNRFEEIDGEREVETIGRTRTEFYDLELFGLGAGPSGLLYSMTEEGDEASPRTMLERISLTDGTLESVSVELASHDCDYRFGQQSKLFVSPDERTLHVIDNRCFGVIDLASLTP
jgi:hypothetical protein